MRYRQVHIDFHTSEHIDKIGQEFDKIEFQEALKTGHVNSVTLFSKCHHGWSYHPTKENQIHPGLSFDLLKAQIEAAHEIGVKAVVYFSTGYDEKYIREHKDYAVIKKDGTTAFIEDFDTPGYHWICMNTPYLDELAAQVRETLLNYDADGLFLDIAMPWECYCPTCQKLMKEEGIDINDSEAVRLFGERTYIKYASKIEEVANSVKPGIKIFHNCGHVPKGKRDIVGFNTHLELESLPTGAWGYDHFPLSAAYARTLDMEFLGMTGKFHTEWGEFGGFKHPNALRYEVSLSAANGAGCSIGDQLHPNGKMDMATYKLIGEAYSELEEKEPWLEGAKNMADIGILSAEAIDSYYDRKGKGDFRISDHADVDAGCTRILLEGKYLFNVIDTDEDFSKYKLIILPDSIVSDEQLTLKLKEFTTCGGKILATGKSGTDENGKFVLDFGAEFSGKNEYMPSYIRPAFKLRSLDNSAFVMYNQGYRLENVSGELLATGENPYFNRCVEKFCSHKHTPNNPEEKFPVSVMGKDGAYIGFDMFREYFNVGSITTKQILTHVIDELLTDKTVKTNLPSSGVVTVTNQNDRRVVHLLYADLVKRGCNTEIIEDLIHLYNIEVSVKFDKKPKRVYLAPQNKDINFEFKDGYVNFKVDFSCHQMIVIE